MRDVGRCREARGEDALDEPRLGRFDIRWNESERHCLGANALEIEPRAVVGNLDGDFVALLADRELNLAGFRFSLLDPRLAAFDAVIERIAQQVLERSHEFLQHRAVKLDLSAVELEISALVELLHGLAHDAVQPLR